MLEAKDALCCSIEVTRAYRSYLHFYLLNEFYFNSIHRPKPIKISSRQTGLVNSQVWFPFHRQTSLILLLNQLSNSLLSSEIGYLDCSITGSLVDTGRHTSSNLLQKFQLTNFSLLLKFVSSLTFVFPCRPPS